MHRTRSLVATCLPRLTKTGQPQPDASAFTLVELLVVVAVVSLLLGLLLPAMNSSREIAHLVMNQSNHRQLGIGQFANAADNQEEYASVNTGINADIQLRYAWSKEDARRLMEFDKTSATPTSLLDWISPSLGTELGLSINRAERTYQIFARFADPAAERINDVIYPSSPHVADDYQQFLDIQEDRGFPQISYLAPSTFHYGGFNGGILPRQYANEAGGVFLGSGPEGTKRFGVNGFSSTMDVPNNFSPRLDKVGAGSTKILAADGTRYWTGDLLDFDVNAVPDIYGSFLSQTPIREDSTAYKRDRIIPYRPPPFDRFVNDHWKFSVRHLGHTRLVATFFDGHAEDLTIEEAYGNVDMWAPRGTTIDGDNDLTAEAAQHIQEALGSQVSRSNLYTIP